MFALPLIAGAFYVLVTFTTSHCNDFKCDPMKAPVHFESAVKHKTGK